MQIHSLLSMLSYICSSKRKGGRSEHARVPDCVVKMIGEGSLSVVRPASQTLGGWSAAALGLDRVARL